MTSYIEFHSIASRGREKQAVGKCSINPIIKSIISDHPR